MAILLKASFIFMVFRCLCCCHSSQKPPLLFVLTKYIQKGGLYSVVIVAKGFLKLPNFSILMKKIYQKPGSCNVLQTVSSVLRESKSATPPLFNNPQTLPSASDKVKLFANNLTMNSNFDDFSFLWLFYLIDLIKLLNISITPELVKKVVTNLCQKYLVLFVFQKYKPELS